MRLFAVVHAIFLLLIAGCAQIQNVDSEKIQTIQSNNLSLDDLTLEEIKKLPFDDVLNMFLELDVTRLVNIKDSKDPLKPKIQEVFSRLTNNSRLDENICVIRKIGGDEGNVYAWKIKDEKLTLKVVQKAGSILLTYLGGVSEHSFGVMRDRKYFAEWEQLFWILRASNSNHALPFLWLIANSDRFGFSELALTSFAAIRTRSSLYAAWKCNYDGSRKLEVLQDMTGKDWDYEKLSTWIGENNKRIWFDSEGILYFDDELADYGKMDQEYFLTDVDE